VTAILTRSYRPTWDEHNQLNLAAMFAPVRHGAADPCFRRIGDTVWRAFNSAAGAVTLRIQRVSDGVEATAWGAGAAWAIEHLPVMLAADDDASTFDVRQFANGVWHPHLRTRAVSLSRQWRPGAIAPLVDHLVASILEQRVTGIEAHRAWRYLVLNFGDVAPGVVGADAGDVPANLRVPPAPSQWQRIESWHWHRAGVDSARADTIMRSVARLDHREPDLVSPVHIAVLAQVRGIGVWTLALLRQSVLADADAVQFGDFHTSHDVVHALTGEHRADDARMAQVLQPWMGDRYRVVRLVELTGISAPRRGPRLAPADHRDR
jgi:3-methyladenine DNA glycosylase/8-oxoguanine DNA glycosylase